MQPFYCPKKYWLPNFISKDFNAESLSVIDWSSDIIDVHMLAYGFFIRGQLASIPSTLSIISPQGGFSQSYRPNYQIEFAFIGTEIREFVANTQIGTPFYGQFYLLGAPTFLSDSIATDIWDEYILRANSKVDEGSKMQRILK